MSIANEIQRIETAKADIKKAIEEKGVEVGDGLIDTYAEKIALISGGGGDSYYDTFWDSYQNYGNRVDYTNGFGSCWTKETFKPKYDIKPTNAYMFMRYAPLDNVDMVEHLEKLGITLDFSNCTNCQYGFYGAKISRLGVIDLRKIKSATADGVFSSAYLKTIDLLKVSEEQTNLSWFSEATVLENITIEGVIAANLNMSKCSNLTHESLMSIINALKDFRLVNSTYSNVTYYWDGTEGNGKIGEVYDCVFTSPNGSEVSFNCSWGDYETEYHIIVLKVRNLNITEEELSEVKTFMIDSNGNLVLGINQGNPTTTKTLTLHADAKARLTADELKIATDKGWNVV